MTLQKALVAPVLIKDETTDRVFCAEYFSAFMKKGLDCCIFVRVDFRLLFLVQRSVG